MRAIRHHVPGPPDVLTLEELPDLAPAPGEVRVAVEAAGVHLLDTALRRGEAGGPMAPPDLPTVPGREVAGVVDRLGDGVDPSWLGRRVVAHLGMVPGGYAEQAVVDHGLLLPVPDGVSLSDAVAAVGTGRTALGVVELEPAAAGEVALVLSAAGGLGWLLAQSALAAGATVVAAAGSAERVAELGPLGAHRSLDYSRAGWSDGLTVDVVYDGVGGAVGRSALEALRPGGRMVMFGWSAGAPTRLDTDDLVQRGITAGWSLGPRMQRLPGGVPGLAARALAKVAAGEWRPLVTAYPLAEAARAHADLEARRALGKVVLQPERPSRG